MTIETLQLVETYREEISHVSLDWALGLPSGSVESVVIHALMRRPGQGPLLCGEIFPKLTSVPPGWTGEAIIDPDKPSDNVRLIGAEIAAAGLPTGNFAFLQSYCALSDGFLIIGGPDKIGFCPADGGTLRRLTVTTPLVGTRRHGLRPVGRLQSAGNVIPVPMSGGMDYSALAFLHIDAARQTADWSTSPKLTKSGILGQFFAQYLKSRAVAEDDLLTLRSQDWPDFFMKPEFPDIASAVLTESGPLIFTRGSQLGSHKLPEIEGVARVDPRGAVTEMLHLDVAPPEGAVPELLNSSASLSSSGTYLLRWVVPARAPSTSSYECIDLRTGVRRHLPIEQGARRPHLHDHVDGCFLVTASHLERDKDRDLAVVEYRVAE